MVKYVAPILPHVHFRGKEYKQNYLELGFRDAMAVGALAVIEQPNPQPHLVDLKTILRRKADGERFRRNIIHRIHMGLTNDLEQAEGAFIAAKDHYADIYSVKAFWTHSTGNMGILDPDKQKRIWKIAANFGYEGVFFQHLEDESHYIGEFNPANPITHSLRQNEGAEVIQAMKQIRYASDAKFKGIFYAAHVSSPDTVNYLNWERRRVPFQIVIETTGHHEFLHFVDYQIHGNRVKMNPPLRDPRSQAKLLEKVVKEETDIIGDDHAPHPVELKDYAKPPSGIPAIAFLPKRIELLLGLGMRRSHLDKLLFENANAMFGFGLNKKEVDVEYNPELWDDYGYNPWNSGHDGNVCFLTSYTGCTDSDIYLGKGS